jgi:nucleotide-binding universal stress UspA family protein
MKKILIAHDGSKTSKKALKMAVELAVKFDAVLYVLSVIPELYLTELAEMDRERIIDALTTETHKNMERVKTSLRSKSVDSRTLIRQGDPSETIMEAARKMRVNIIITGSHGRHGTSKFLLGSVSSKVVEHAHCPVLVVK